MKGYTTKAIRLFNHKPPNKTVHSSSIFKWPEYGKKVQYTYVDNSNKLTAHEIKQIQKVAEKFLYSGRKIDNTIMHALDEINIEATKATEKTKLAVDHFNLLWNPSGSKNILQIQWHEIQIDSDAAYLVSPKARSRAGGYHFLGNKDGKLFNREIFILAKLIKAVMASGAEAQCSVLYMNARKAIPII